MSLNNKEKNYVSLVTYVHNNEDKIKDFLLNVDKVFSENFEHYEYVIINDNSTDNSMKEVKSLANKIIGNMTIVNLSYKHGVEKAMTAGHKIAIGDFVFELDSVIVDYNVESLLDIYHKSLEGFDVVSLSPKGKTKGFSNMFYSILEKNTEQKMRLYTETARVLSRRAINRVSILDNKIEYRKASYHYCGLPDAYVFYDPKNNIRINNNSFNDKFDLANDVIIRYSNFAAKFSFGLSMAFLAFTLLTMVYVVVCYLTMSNIQNGWTTTMFFLSVSFSGLFLMMSFLFRYLDVLVRDKYISTDYSFKSVEQIKNTKDK